MVLGLASGHVALAQAHDAWAAEFAEEKERLAKLHSRDREGYQREKDRVVEKILSSAVAGVA